ncbi:hypothetical protein C1H57_00460 [Clostridium sp. 2-1]|uniref:hypothetical protein n=1 Tax=Clostridium TaxID=1485 RepID=UPI000CDB7036|nr:MULTISPECIES: hypothetical protein [Clostridium]MBN7573073.1 hypothetical protein [Clostridium beijerinckii]MBN7578412.1 hypothetical protein [Clostridium beijerinckii]MBN7582847.1 hypothetical protein [Clostridium beijerinckii]MBO0519012.1 hypothetical protein [Clostridium beijerinckii]POO93277.1 hypothetical protein C1H57_00460 [Clostridium sp. 2-1]
MEFKLNKIDTDIRKKIQEETKEDKVHSGKGISIKKDVKEEDFEEKDCHSEKDHEKRYFTVNGVKYNQKNIDIKVEKIEKINEGNSKGSILDTVK